MVDENAQHDLKMRDQTARYRKRASPGAPSVLVVLTDEVLPLRENEQINVVEDAVQAAFVALECAGCVTTQLVEVDQHSVSAEGRAQGAETQTDYHAEVPCISCASPLGADLSFVEYPVGIMGLYDFRASEQARLAQIEGFRPFLRTLRHRGVFSRALQNELLDTRNLLRDMESQAPSLVRSLEGASAAMSRSVAVFGSYKKAHYPRLEQIQRELARLGREAIITDQVAPNRGDFVRDISRRVAALTNFTILYDNEASGANNEIEMIVNLERPLAILRETGHPGSSQIITGLDKKHVFVKVFEIGPDLSRTLAEILGWADALIASWDAAPGVSKSV